MGNRSRFQLWLSLWVHCVIIPSLGLNFFVCKIKEELISLILLYFSRIGKETEVRGLSWRMQKV